MANIALSRAALSFASYFYLSAAVADIVMPAKSLREQCPYYQQMGCLLDIAEKACEPDEGDPRTLIDHKSPESVWLCCCDKPYAECSRKDGSATCNAALDAHFKPLVKVGDPSRREVLSALQAARGELKKAGGDQCSVFAEEEPRSACGFQAEPPVKRSLERADLFCEMLTWQWEELGDGNAKEFKAHGCPFIKKDKGKGGDSRKGGVLRHDGEL